MMIRCGKNKRRLCVLCFMVCTIACLLAFSSFAKDADGKTVVVSMGDSYSSGEGNEPFYGETVNGKELSRAEKAVRDDWTAHRSTKSWEGRLEFSTLSGSLSQNYNDAYEEGDNDNWYFVAASGAQTFNIAGVVDEKRERSVIISSDKDTKTGKTSVTTAYDRILENSAKETGRYYCQPKTTLVAGNEIRHILPYQTDVFKILAEDNKVADYVTISIGGNDVGFADIVAEAVTSGGKVDLFIEKFIIKYPDIAADIITDLTCWDISSILEEIKTDLGITDLDIAALVNEARANGGVSDPNIITILDLMDLMNLSKDLSDFWSKNFVTIRKKIIENIIEPKVKVIVSLVIDSYLQDLECDYQKRSVIQGKVDQVIEKYCPKDGKGILYDRLKDTYKAIISRSGNPDLRIIVLGYPRLLDPKNGANLIYKDDAAAIDGGCEYFDSWLHNAVISIEKELKSEQTFDFRHDWTGGIYYSSVLDEFGEDHSAGSAQPWLYDIMTTLNNGGDQIWSSEELLGSNISMVVSSYCVHPNDKGGLQAYANCAQRKVDEVECSVCGTVTDSETGIPIRNAVVRIYKNDREEREADERDLSFMQQLARFVYGNIFKSKGSDPDDDEQEIVTDPYDDDLIAECTTNEKGEFNFFRLPDERDGVIISVSCGGYFGIDYSAVAKRKADCIDNDSETIRKSGSEKEHHQTDKEYYYFDFELEKQDVKKLLCGTWLSDSLHWSMSAYMEIRKDGSCALDYLDLYKWSINDNIITFRDTVGGGMERSYPFEVTENKLILYNPEGNAFINYADKGEVAVYYRQD